MNVTTSALARLLEVSTEHKEIAMGVDAWSDDSDPRPVAGTVGDFMVELGLAEMDLPHIVLCRDSKGVTASFSGPYPSAVEALVAADVEHRIEVASDGVEALTLSGGCAVPRVDPRPGRSSCAWLTAGTARLPATPHGGALTSPPDERSDRPFRGRRPRAHLPRSRR